MTNQTIKKNIFTGIYGLTMVLFVLLLSGCVSREHLTYSDPNHPVYSKPVLHQFSMPKPDAALKIVSYNIEHSNKVDKAIAILRNHDTLKDADILCLQEMDLAGIQKIADELELGYVYYPSVRHAFSHKDFGNAILSRWPLSKSKKLILPVEGLTHMQRIMIGANVRVGQKTIGTYCLHDDVYLSAYKKRAMAEFVLKNISDDVDYVIVAGDFNTYSRRAQKSVAKEFEEARFIVSTPNVNWISKHWYLFNKKSKIDEIFSQNMELVDSGVVFDRRASDHLPIWAQLKLTDREIASQNRRVKVRYQNSR